MSKQEEMFRRYEKLAKTAKSQLLIRQKSLQVVPAASTAARISSTVNASSADVPTARSMMCFGRDLSDAISSPEKRW